MNSIQRGFAVFLISCLPALLFGQITLTTSDMPVPGDTLPSASDTLAGWVNVGSAGANQTWDFSQAAHHVTTPTRAVAPSSTAYSGSFGTSTVALTNDNVNYLYYKNSASDYIATGIAGDLLMNGQTRAVVFNPTSTTYEFPTQYLNDFSGTSQLQETASGSSVNQPVDQVRLTVTSNYRDTIDGWGTTITPVGSYASLRQRRVEYVHTLVEIKLFSFSPWTTAADIYDTVRTYNWLAKETKGVVVSLGMDSLDNIVRLNYSLVPPEPVANFSYTNVSGGVVDFTDLTTNSPTSWAWDLGDASATSSQQNPSYNYPANGAYYVCLTASNVSGSDTFCDSVYVTNILPNNPPIARDDTASVTAPNSVTITVMANDQDPDNDPINVSTAYGAGHGTIVVNNDGTIDYTPDPSYAGVDSFFYVICDNSTPTPLCDTATVRVTVAANPTMVSFTTDSVDCEHRLLISTSQNNVGLVSWQYVVDGTTDTTSTFGDTVQLVLSGSNLSYHVCLSAYDAGSNLVTTCNTVDFLLGDSCVTGIADVQPVTLKVYPNPVNSDLVIEQGAAGGNSLGQVFDQFGRQVMELNLQPGVNHVSVEALPAGVYYIRLLSNNNQLLNRKFIKLQ